MDEKGLDKIDGKLDDLQELLVETKKSFEETKSIGLKLDLALDEIKKINTKLDALYDPEKGIFPRIKELESWKGRMEEKEKTQNKIVVSSIIAVIAAAITTLWNVLIRK